MFFLWYICCLCFCPIMSILSKLINLDIWFDAYDENSWIIKCVHKQNIPTTNEVSCVFNRSFTSQGSNGSLIFIASFSKQILYIVGYRAPQTSHNTLLIFSLLDTAVESEHMHSSWLSLALTCTHRFEKISARALGWWAITLAISTDFHSKKEYIFKLCGTK